MRRGVRHRDVGASRRPSVRASRTTFQRRLSPASCKMFALFFKYPKFPNQSKNFQQVPLAVLSCQQFGEQSFEQSSVSHSVSHSVSRTVSYSVSSSVSDSVNS